MFYIKFDFPQQLRPAHLINVNMCRYSQILGCCYVTSSGPHPVERIASAVTYFSSGAKGQSFLQFWMAFILENYDQMLR